MISLSMYCDGDGCTSRHLDTSDKVFCENCMDKKDARVEELEGALDEASAAIHERDRLRAENKALRSALEDIVHVARLGRVVNCETIAKAALEERRAA